MAEPSIQPVKSWFQAKYPLHPCPICQLEHVRIPHVQKGGMSFIPFEVLQVVEGTARPGAKTTGLDMPAYVYGLFWGIPGGTPQLCDILYAN